MVIKIQKKSFKGCENDIYLKYIAKIEKVLCNLGIPQPYLYDRFTFSFFSPVFFNVKSSLFPMTCGRSSLLYP